VSSRKPYHPRQHLQSCLQSFNACAQNSASHLLCSSLHSPNTQVSPRFQALPGTRSLCIGPDNLSCRIHTSEAAVGARHSALSLMPQCFAKFDLGSHATAPLSGGLPRWLGDSCVSGRRFASTLCFTQPAKSALLASGSPPGFYGCCIDVVLAARASVLAVRYLRTATNQHIDSVAWRIVCRC